MNQEFETPIQVAADYWATQIRFKQDPAASEQVRAKNEAEFNAKISVFTSALQTAFFDALPHFSEKRLCSISHNTPGKWVQIAFEAAYGANQSNWPYITPHICVIITPDSVQTGSNRFGSADDYEVLWQK